MEVPKRRKLSSSSSSSSTQAEILALLPVNPSELSPSSSSTQSSAATVAGNDDLLTEILVRLPVKSLVRFKSVSVHWRSLMSSGSFSRLHLLNHGRRPPEALSFILGVRGRSQLLICHPFIKKLARFPLPRNFDFRYYADVKIVQSCNGLLLVKTKTREARRVGRISYYVVNPTTVQSRCITTPQLEPIAVCLLFDPLKSPYYRVVAFWKENPDDYRGNIDRFSVYDSAAHDWKDGGEVPNVGFTLPDGVCCNERAYFVGPINPSLCYSPDKKLRILPKPPTKSTTRYIVESNGHLHCLHLSFRGNVPYFNIAEMIDDEWVKYPMKGMHTIANTANVELLGMIRTERIEDSTFLVHVPGRIMIYRFDEGCDVVVDYRSDFFYEEGHFQFEFEDAYPFTPNFASV